MYTYLKEWVKPPFDINKPIFADIETSIPRNQKSKKKILALYGETRLVQLAQEAVCYIYDCYFVNIEEIKSYLKDSHLVFHNAIYDLTCLQWQPKAFDCTLYLAKHKFPMLESYSLQNLLEYFRLGTKTDEGSSDWSSLVLTKEQLDYAAQDTLLLQKLYEIVGPGNSLYKLDRDNLSYALEYAKNGLPIHNRNRLKRIKELKEVTYELPESLNINSPKQVKEYLGSADTTSNTLTIMTLDGNRKAAEILRKRKDLKQLSFLEDKFAFPRIYGIFNPFGAKSGRWTCKGNGHSKASQNLQQLPRDLKDCLGVEDHRFLVDADYTALEIHTVACIMGETKMVEIMEQGGDLHYATACMIYNKKQKDVTKRERQIAKGLNFSLAYGGGANMARLFLMSLSNILLPEEEIAELRTRWLNAYPNIQAYHRQVGKHNFDKGPMEVISPFGRRMRANSYTEAINMPCQSAGADCTKLALRYLHERLPEAKIVNTVHDSITLEVESEEEGHRQGKILKQCMDDSWATFCEKADPNILKIRHLRMDNQYDVIKTIAEA